MKEKTKGLHTTHTHWKPWRRLYSALNE